MRTLMLLAALLLTSLATAAGAFERSRVEIVRQDGIRHSFDVEIARRPEELAQGLMHRPSLPDGSGMLFDFGMPQRVSMWMKDTLIPLDMLFVAPDGNISRIAERTTPGSLETIPSQGTVLAVLELKAGTAARLGIKVGDRLLHPIFGGR